MASRTTAGRYEILQPLTSGGMAELFVASLPGIAGFTKRVVIKRVLPSLARERAFIDMFLAEARLAASLQHQNIVQVYDLGEDADGPFFAMEHLHGADVGAVLQAQQAGLPLPLALHIVCEACAGLHYAHERRGADGEPLAIVHRDVSPQNLFVTFDGGVKLLDFGIAKAVEQIANSATRTGTLRGKIPYMSPEQCQGQALDRRSDVFAIGVVLWEITVGQRLFGANSESDFEVLKSIVESDAPRPSTRMSGYPAALETIVMNALARDREQRYQSCDALAADLDTFRSTHALWSSARELAGFMRQTFSDRAAASQRLDVAAVMAELPRMTRELPPSTRETVELRPSAPDLESRSRAEAAPPAVATSSMRRAVPLWVFAITLAFVAVLTLVIAYLVRTSSEAPSEPARAAAASDAAVRATSSQLSPAPSTLPSQDAMWLAPDDYLISEQPFTGGSLDSVAIGRMQAQPDAHGQATFLSGKGAQVKTAYYWRSYASRPAELVPGKLATCPGSAYHQPYVPSDHVEMRTADWTIGWITSEPTGDTVQIADRKCAVTMVRMIYEASMNAPQSGEDAMWFAPDDYLIAKKPFTDGRLAPVAIAKRRVAPDDSGDAVFLTAKGQEWKTAHFWTSHLASDNELTVGALAACPDHDVRYFVPKTKAQMRNASWMIGLITTEPVDGKVQVADRTCLVKHVRIVER